MDFPSEEIPTYEIQYLTLKKVKEIENVEKNCFITFLTNTIPNKKVLEIKLK